MSTAPAAGGEDATGATLIGKRSGVETADDNDEDIERGKRNKPSEDAPADGSQEAAALLGATPLATTATAAAASAVTNGSTKSSKLRRREDVYQGGEGEEAADDELAGDHRAKMGKIGDGTPANLTASNDNGGAAVESQPAAAAAVSEEVKARMQRCKERIDEMIQDQLLERAPAGSIVAIPSNFGATA